MNYDIKKLLRKDGNINFSLIRSVKFRNSLLYHNIINETLFLRNVSFSERVYCLINNISSKKYCQCGSEINFINFKSGYRTFCSSKCSAVSQVTRKKAQATCLEKYGFSSFTKTSICKTKRKETNLERYGVENPLLNEHIIKKSKKTKLERYGNEFYTNRCKFKNTNLERYGVEHPWQNKEIKSRIKKTNLERYGAENPFGSDIIKEKIKNTNLEKYGVKYYIQCHIPKEVLKKLDSKKWLVNEHIKLKKTQTQISHELKVDITTISNYIKKHDIDVLYHGSSYPEHLLVEYIQKTYNTKVICNSRKIIKPYELDMYLPEYHLAIEYNGVYWHNPSRYGSKLQWFVYHQNKEELCNSQGIELLHIWENYLDHNTLISDAINGIIDNNLEEVYQKIWSKK